MEISKRQALPKENLLSYLRRNQIILSAPCGGQGQCGKCLVRVIAGKVGEPSVTEQQLLAKRGLAEGWRLACMLTITEDLVIELSEELASEAVSHGQILSQVTTVGTDQNKFWTDKMTAAELVPWYTDQTACLGVAIDIGTTTIVIYLIDLSNGKQVSVEAFLNPQKKYGADVLTRIQIAKQSHESYQQLHKDLIDIINQALQGLLLQGGWQQQQLCRVVVAGNTTMLHFLLNEPVDGLAAAPFQPVFLAGQRRKAAELGLYTNAQADLLTLPCIAAYAGGDLVAGLQACGFFDRSGINLLVDIGTNGEICLSDGQRFVACSTAAGPAFEGGRLTWGIGAIAGAIDHVEMGESLTFTTINQQKPIGLCGSGIVDLVAVLLDQGCLDKQGLLQQNEQQERVFYLDDTRTISINQQDLRELQLAKAAIYAGIQCLLEELQVSAADVEQVWLAGGFGNYLNPDQALRIGLFPSVFQHKIKPVGNTAGQGACEVLRSERLFARLDQLIQNKHVKYLDLGLTDGFQTNFLSALDF